MWARIMKERFNAKKPESMRLRFHTQTAGCSLVAQQPMNNIVRVTIQALAAVLGGTQSLHTNSMDETLALPTEQAVTVALRTQQIIAEESGVANVIDPLGGSYFIEKLTDEMEQEAWNYINKIDQMGGIVSAIEKGYPQMEIADAAYRYQKQVENQQKIVVGVNKYKMDEKDTIPILSIPKEVEQRQIERTKKIKTERDNNLVNKTLSRLKEAAKNNENLVPFVLDAVKAYASIGEIMDVMRTVFGEYRDPAIF
jgi:methylmalonyl-CoA mutase (EC 5.4.99.2)